MCIKGAGVDFMESGVDRCALAEVTMDAGLASGLCFHEVSRCSSLTYSMGVASLLLCPVMLYGSAFLVCAAASEFGSATVVP